MPKPVSIKDNGGLEPHLNATAEYHNGIDYAMYKKLKDAGVGPVNRARAMKVSYNTMSKYDMIHEEEEKERQLKNVQAG